jgi:hypothetical protein
MTGRAVGYTTRNPVTWLGNPGFPKAARTANQIPPRCAVAGSRASGPEPRYSVGQRGSRIGVQARDHIDCRCRRRITSQQARAAL